MVIFTRMVEASKKLSFFSQLIALLILGLVVVYVIDPLDPSTSSTPFCLGIVLMGLSLRQRTFLVAATSFIYSILTVIALIKFHEARVAIGHITPHPYFWWFQRMGLFLVVCGLSIYLAHYRTNTDGIIAHIRNILAKLPTPVVISDAAGHIVFVNEALAIAFKQDGFKLTGKRYVDNFMPDVQEGKAMRYYIELFGAEADGIHDLELRPFDGLVKMNARLTCLGTGANRVMVTVLSHREQT